MNSEPSDFQSKYSKRCGRIKVSAGVTKRVTRAAGRTAAPPTERRGAPPPGRAANQRRGPVSWLALLPPPSSSFMHPPEPFLFFLFILHPTCLKLDILAPITKNDKFNKKQNKKEVGFISERRIVALERVRIDPRACTIRRLKRISCSPAFFPSPLPPSAGCAAPDESAAERYNPRPVGAHSNARQALSGPRAGEALSLSLSLETHPNANHYPGAFCASPNYSLRNGKIARSPIGALHAGV